MLSAGGVLGVNARYWLGVWLSQRVGPGFPWATFAINVSGALAIGALTVVLAHWLPHPNASLLLVTGFLGGYTTFSTFALEAVTLWERGQRGMALAYVSGSVGAGLAAAVVGITLARALVVPTPSRAGRPHEATAIPEPSSLLRLYVNASERHEGRPLYEVVVARARALDMAGASVFLVDLSFGAHRRFRDARSEYNAVAIPVVIEVVDAPKRIEALLGEIGPMVSAGLMTIEPARVLHYGHHSDRVG
jgi:CrcB protein